MRTPYGARLGGILPVAGGKSPVLGVSGHGRDPSGEPPYVFGRRSRRRRGGGAAGRNGKAPSGPCPFDSLCPRRVFRAWQKNRYLRLFREEKTKEVDVGRERLLVSTVWQKGERLRAAAFSEEDLYHRTPVAYSPPKKAEQQKKTDMDWIPYRLFVFRKPRHGGGVQ